MSTKELLRSEMTTSFIHLSRRKELQERGPCSPLGNFRVKPIRTKTAFVHTDFS